MQKSVIIIGSGIAGMSAGIYSRMNGYSTVIFEMSKNPGGLCTSWKRADYMFDGCIHWLTGSDPSSEYYSLWEEIGAVQGKKFFNHDFILKLRETNGEYFTIYTDPHKMRNELIRVAPEDTKEIVKLSQDIRKFRDNPLPYKIGLKNLGRTLTALRLFYKYRMTAREYAQRFKSPRLREMFGEHIDWNGMSVGFTFWTMGMMSLNQAGYPVGGSRAFSLSVARRYESLGGTIEYSKKVTQIITENGKAVGVKLSSGEERRADIVISACDGRFTIYELLGGKFINDKIEKIYKTLRPVSPLLLSFYGVRGTYNSEYSDTVVKLKKPVTIANKVINRINVTVYNFDPTLAPYGHTVFMVMIPTEFEYWKNLKGDKEGYFHEKKRVSEVLLRAMSEAYPDVVDHAEVFDVATPMTFVRYTGIQNGSYGWVLDKNSMTINIPKTLPGLKNFYMAGQWTTPGGGLPSGVMTGRKIVQMMCKADKKKFTASKP